MVAEGEKVVLWARDTMWERREKVPLQVSVGRDWDVWLLAIGGKVGLKGVCLFDLLVFLVFACSSTLQLLELSLCARLRWASCRCHGYCMA